MKRLLVLVLLLMIPAVTQAQGCFASTIVQTNITSAPMDSTGATLLWGVVTIYQGSFLPESNFIIDSMGNNWQYGPEYGKGESVQNTRIIYAPHPLTSTAHTFHFNFSAGANPAFPSAVICAATGTAQRDVLRAQSGLSTNLGADTVPLSIAAVTGDLVVTGLGANLPDVNPGTVTISIDSGFSAPVASLNNSYEVGAASFLVAGSTGAVSPTWTLSGGTDRCHNGGLQTGCTGAIAVFKGSSSPQPTMTGPRIFTFAGNGLEGYSASGVPATSATLFWPVGAGLDVAGNVYFASVNANRIFAVNTQSTTQTLLNVSVPARYAAVVAGTGTQTSTGNGGPALSATLAHPVSIAINSAGDVCTADQQGHQVRCIDHATGVINAVAGDGTNFGCGGGGGSFSGDGGAATSAGLNCPQGIAFDANDNLYISDTNNQRVRAVCNQVAGCTILNVSIPYHDINTIVGTGVTGYNGDGIAATTARLNSPLGLGLDSTGNLYIADLLNVRIRKVTPAGTISTFAGNGTVGYSGDGAAATSAEIAYPFDVKSDTSGNIYITDTSNNVIRKVDVSTGFISTIAGKFSTFGPTSPASYSDMFNYGTSAGGYCCDGDPALNAGLLYPAGIAIAPNGDYYITDLGSNRVRKVVLSNFYGAGIKLGTGIKSGVGLK